CRSVLSLSMLLCSLFDLPPPSSTLFPYTTLFRSAWTEATGRDRVRLDELPGALTGLWKRRDFHGLNQTVINGEAMTNVFIGYNRDRKSTRLNSSHVSISYAVFCLKKKNIYAIVIR